MKNQRMKGFLPILALLLSLSAGAQSIDPKSLIENRRLVFQAVTALPTGGSAVYLNTAYDLRLQGDTLQVFLPYFGRSFAPVYPGSANSSGLQFTSTDFAMKSRQLRKGGWEIRITPEDQREVRELILTTGENGYGSLQVLSNNRQPISFNGNVIAGRAK